MVALDDPPDSHLNELVEPLTVDEVLGSVFIGRHNDIYRRLRMVENHGDNRKKGVSLDGPHQIDLSDEVPLSPHYDCTNRESLADGYQSVEVIEVVKGYFLVAVKVL